MCASDAWRTTALNASSCAARASRATSSAASTMRLASAVSLAILARASSSSRTSARSRSNFSFSKASRSALRARESLRKRDSSTSSFARNNAREVSVTAGPEGPLGEDPEEAEEAAAEAGTVPMMRTFGEVPSVRPEDGRGEPTGEVCLLLARLDAREGPRCAVAAEEGGADGGDCSGRFSGGTVHEAEAVAAVTTDNPALAGGEAAGEADGVELDFCIGGEGAGPAPAAPTEVGANLGEGARDDAAEAVVDLAPLAAGAVAADADEEAGGLEAAAAGPPLDAETGLAAAAFDPSVDAAAFRVFAGTVGVDGADVNVEALSSEVVAVGEARGELAGAELREVVAPLWVTEKDTGTDGWRTGIAAADPGAAAVVEEEAEPFASSARA